LKKRQGIPLSAKELRAAVAAVSSEGTFSFTLRNLFYELVRRESLPGPTREPEDGLASLRGAVRRYERQHGVLHALIRPDRVARRRPPRSVEPDLYDYSVRRVIAFDRIDTMLLFAMNGFHRRVEVGLVVLDGFPGHVWSALRRQLRAGTPTTFLVVHDCDAHGLDAATAATRKLARYPSARVVDLGLSFTQALRLGIPVRTAETRPSRQRAQATDRAHVLLSQGNYAHFEEMPPLRAMRWVYQRVAKGAVDVGFG
jgi:hypothetical protein